MSFKQIKLCIWLYHVVLAKITGWLLQEGMKSYSYFSSHWHLMNCWGRMNLFSLGMFDIRKYPASRRVPYIHEETGSPKWAQFLLKNEGTLVKIGSNNPIFWLAIVFWNDFSVTMENFLMMRETSVYLSVWGTRFHKLLRSINKLLISILLPYLYLHQHWVINYISNSKHCLPVVDQVISTKGEALNTTQILVLVLHL